MQLVRNIFIAIALMCTSISFAQNIADSSKIKLDAIEATFLSSYYQQEGDHSPVTGGVGTEKLTNIAPAFIINIPLDTVKSIIFNGGVDFYSSASSDNINNPYLDPHHISGASSGDTRGHLDTEFKKKNNFRNDYRSIIGGLSIEFDVISASIGGAYSRSSKDNNKSIGIKAQYFFDDWKLIYPVELRNGTVQYLNTDKRHTLNFSTTASANINKRLNSSLSFDVVSQSGLLSTPFHRVYFQNSEHAVVEQLPSSRIKLPIGLRLHYYLNDFLILKTFYRFYYDTWDIMGNTAKIEIPIKITRSFRIYPFYRYHLQTAAKYFAPYQTHLDTEEFYTSDYDLSALYSHKYGMGISYTPLFGIFRFKSIADNKKITMLKTLDLRYAQYQRSDGLNASIFTLSLKFVVH